MSLNESIVEDAALEWFGELGYDVGHGLHLAPGEPAAERASFGEVVQSRCTRTLTRPLPRGEEMRETIRRLSPAIRPSGFGTRPSFGPRISAFGLQSYLATLRDTLLPKLLSGELSVAKIVLSGVNE